MQTRTDRRDGLTLVQLAGELDKLTSDAVRSELGRSVGAGDLLVDLTDVTFLDSAGLHVIFRLARAQAEAGATLGVVVPTTSPVRRVVEIAHVEGAAVVCTSVDEGLLQLRNVSLAPPSGTAGPVET